ncbi:ABC transporter ATP-binding protein [Candidatus Lokiarchaeum ossiferum]|uniref:ABC transporter ATP-binding protein n=1 Tax=Candidatus Lokiarchaeum ossiferum TaxID=2951803 RepID=UPI00352BF3FF
MLDINIESKQFQTPQKTTKEVLSQIHFKLSDHDFISIIGPSGCGKTTLLRILAGFDDDFVGEIESSDHNRATRKFSRLGNIGYVPQDFSLFPWLTVEDNIKFGLRIKKYSKDDQSDITTRLLRLVEMEEFRKYYPKDISGGMKQKIAICRAIASNPASNLIVMDEPFSALDAQTRNSIQNDLLHIWHEQHLTIVFVTHNIDEAVFLSNKVIVLGKDPANIQKIESINLPHPRDRTSTEFNSIRKELLTFL